MRGKRIIGKKLSIMVIVMAMIVSTMLSGCGSNSDKKDKKDKNLGLYTAVSAEYAGMSISVEDAFSDGFTIELKEKGKCVLTVDGDSAKGSWTLDGNEFSVKGGGVDCSGTLENGTILLEDVMGTGMSLTLINKDYSGKETASDDDSNGSADGLLSIFSDKNNSDEDVNDTETVSLKEKWEGTWAGYIGFNNCTGIYEAYNDTVFYACYMVLEFEGDNEGKFSLYDDADEKFSSSDFVIDDDTLTAKNGYMLEQEMSPSGCTFHRSTNDPDMIVMSYPILEGDDSLTYTIHLKPWGVRWDDYKDCTYYDIALYSYNAALDANEAPKHGWANPYYNSGSYQSTDNGQTSVEKVDKRTDIQKYWNGDLYGMLKIYEATGDYASYEGYSYDAFGRVEIDEYGDGYLTVWYGYENGNTYDNPTGKIKINVSYEAGFGSHGTAISTGGWMFIDDNYGRIEEMDIVIDPDESDFSDSLYFGNAYSDDYGSMTYIFGLRPWGHRWEDAIANDNIDIETSMHAFYEWYIPLIDEGWAMPDGYELKPTKTMEEREQELIDAAEGQSSTGSYSGTDSATTDTGSSGPGTGGSDEIFQMPKLPDSHIPGETLQLTFPME